MKIKKNNRRVFSSAESFIKPKNITVAVKPIPERCVTVYSYNFRLKLPFVFVYIASDVKNKIKIRLSELRFFVSKVEREMSRMWNMELNDGRAYQL